MSDTALLYDVKLKKVGCVLLQAVYGGDSYLAQRIPNEDWFLAPTPDMQLFRVTREQAEQIVAFHSARRAVAVKGAGLAKGRSALRGRRRQPKPR